MDTLLVAGIDSVVGANWAASYSGKCRVVGVSFSTPIALDGCETTTLAHQDADSINRCLAEYRPDHIVYCGAAAHSSWDSASASSGGKQMIAAAEHWAAAAHQAKCPLTVISSDAVFTGPWMFHREECKSLCDSLPARTIREVESAVLETHPQALIVRTNAFGWTPGDLGSGWLETALEQLESNLTGDYDCLRHATPILTTDLVDIVERIWAANFSGIFHVAGGERTNPARFVAELAHVFELPVPEFPPTAHISERPTGFGRGETSLHSSKLRKQVGAVAPMLRDGLNRLKEQAENGYRERLHSQSAKAARRVA